MNDQSGSSQAIQTNIHPGRLFLCSCLALISTSVAFGVITSNMDQFKAHFLLSNAQAGLIGGVTLWGFTISIFILGPLVDIMGIHWQMRIAFACHFVGTLIMVFAQGFGTLFTGGFLIALGNGTVEAACNPLVATLFPKNKTTKLNRFHVWFPGGILISGVLAYLLDNSLFAEEGAKVAGLLAWQFKLMLVLVPTILYGILFLGQTFPKTERVQSGVSTKEMFQAVLNPLFLLIFACMALTASLELGPGRWMSTAMSGVMAWAGVGAGILVLAYGNGLMAVLRFFAGGIVHRLAPTGMLLMSTVLAGVGLFLLSLVTHPFIVFVVATIYYAGVCYFWPTMLGFVSEQFPRTGSLGLALMGGMGMAFTGLITTAVMGMIGDTYLHRGLVEQQQEVRAVLSQSAIEINISDDPANPKMAPVATIAGYPELPAGLTAHALQEVIAAAENPELVQAARDVLIPADNNGMRWGFRWTSALAVPLVIVFGGLFLHFKKKGGYRAETI